MKTDASLLIALYLFDLVGEERFELSCTKASEPKSDVSSQFHHTPLNFILLQLFKLSTLSSFSGC